MPTLTIMVGVPASGKSTRAEEISKKTGAVIHSSDSLRAEMFGNKQYDSSDNPSLFNELHKRVIDDLSSGKDVVVDACSIGKDSRLSLLNKVKDIECQKEAQFMAIPLEICQFRNSNRGNKVPQDYISRQFSNLCTPSKEEGFDKIVFNGVVV